MSPDRPSVAVFRGGYTGEAVISHQSARRMLEAIDRDRYDPFYITIAHDRWDDRLVLTAPTPALQKFLLRIAGTEEAFGDPMVLQRVK